MGTVIRPELSKKNKYYISRYRYYELKYHCLQYPEWVKELRECREDIMSTTSLIFQKKEKCLEDKVSEIAIRKNSLERKIGQIVACCKEADPCLWEYLLLAVTEGVSWTWLSTVKRIPCCKETYYDRYRRFFYILSRNLQTS